MIKLDEDALICDFAETYHVFNYRGLPLTYAAVLASGLRDDSRIKMKIAKLTVSFDTLLLCAILDAARVGNWMQTKDGIKGRNIPESLTQSIIGMNEKDGNAGFSSGEDFESERRRLIEGK